MKQQLSDFSLYIICILLAAVIFTVDLQLPLGIASGVPYIIVILAALWSSRKDFAIYLALICTLLILLGLIYSPTGGETWKVLTNRFLAIFAIWVTAILALMWKVHEENIISVQREMESEKEKIYLATIHGAQHILYNLLNQLKLIQIKAHAGGIIDEKTLKSFDKTLVEASALMKSLAEVEQMNEDKIKQAIHPKH